MNSLFPSYSQGLKLNEHLCSRYVLYYSLLARNWNYRDNKLVNIRENLVLENISEHTEITSRRTDMNLKSQLRDIRR